MPLKESTFPPVILILLAFFICSGSNGAISKEIQFSAQYYNDQGLSSFNEGFYNLLPTGKKEEAARCFEDAITSFKKALKINHDLVEAHRNLARVYYVRKEYAPAVEEYKKVVALAPYDMNARLAMASAYTKLGMNDEAVEQLTAAKEMSDDPAVIEKLDRLIEGIDGTN